LAGVARPAAAQERREDGDERRGNTVETRTAVPAVRADSPASLFSRRGNIAISSDAGLSLENTSVSGVDGSTTSLVLRPAVDYFVIDYLSVGGFLGLNYISAPGGSATVFSVGPRVGYDFPFSGRLSIWPKVGLSIASTNVDGDAIEGVDDDGGNTALQLNLFVPLMFHPVEHFFLGLGPAFDLDLTGDNKATTLGVRLTLGGWV
ncbi:MAG TPA: hypothetical protein VGK73_17060, partial [Polyangiaceae bacterium]